MQIPLISCDDAMWNYFEPELAKRLAEPDADDSTSARVRSALSELLPSGACAIEDAAEKPARTSEGGPSLAPSGHQLSAVVI